MSNLKFKLLISYISSFILLDLIILYFNPIKGDTIFDKTFEVENNALKNFKTSYLNTSGLNQENSFDLQKQLKKDIKNHENNFLYLLGLEKEAINSGFEIDIESDIQYEKDNLYYAEGDVIVYFSNSSLKGDKLIYDKINKTLNIYGNVIFSKGNQYFEASKVFYNLKLKEGFIENIYGIIDAKTLVDDFEFKNIKTINTLGDFSEVDKLEYNNSAKVDLANNIPGRNFNIAKFNFNIPSINKWRYKSNRLNFKNEVVQSKEILFTNDAINKPQFILKSRNFTGRVINQKIKLVSANTFMMLDDKLVLPIGRRTIFEKEGSSTWGFGSDFKDKDGFYISRSFNNIKLNENFKINYVPYFLLQRSLKGSTKSFSAKNHSILSPKVKDDIEIFDLIALDVEIKGNLGKWDLNLESKLNSLNPDRLSESFRNKFTLQKTIDLNNNLNSQNNSFFEDASKDDISNNINLQTYSENKEKKTKDNLQKEVYKNFLDLKISSAFREKVPKGYSGESEIYFGNALTIANRRLWVKGKNNKKINFIYNFGKFKAKAKDNNSFDDLFRNVFAVNLGNKYPLLTLKEKDKNINNEYRYTPSIIKQGINWNTNIQTAVFLYSDGKSQEAISLSLGPSITLGKFKKDFFDFTNIDIRNIYVLKNGQSPFEFDDINKNFRTNLEIKQQLLGPLVISYGTSYNFKEGTFKSPRYGLDVKRRAYSVGFFYDTQNERAGLQFNIFNFDYSGISSKF